MQTLIRQRGFIPAALVLPLLYAVAAIAASIIVGTLIFKAWHAFTGSYRAEGRAEVRAAWAPLIDECERTEAAKSSKPPALATACAAAWLGAVALAAREAKNSKTWEGNYTHCAAVLGQQTAAIDEAGKQVAAARELASRTLAEMAKQSKATAAKIDEFKRRAASPAASDKEACNVATRALDELGAMRLRYDAGRAAAAPAAGSGDSNGGRQGSGSDSLRISR